MNDVRESIKDSEHRLFERYGLEVESRFVQLRDPPIRVRVLDVGSGPLTLFAHGAGALAGLWAPLVAEMHGRRSIAVDLPGFGLSDGFDHRGVDLRKHAVAVLTSLLDALAIDSAPIIGSSFGGMWSLWLALDDPRRVQTLVLIGAPAIALPGAKWKAMLAIMSVPGLNRFLLRIPPPSIGLTRMSLVAVAGRQALARVAPEIVEVLHHALRAPAYAIAMSSLMEGILRVGSPRRELVLSNEELGRVAQRTLFLWGDQDAFGGPDLGARAVRSMPAARIEVISGGHYLWFDDAKGCARSILSVLAEEVA